jgi:hypothetical protein
MKKSLVLVMVAILMAICVASSFASANVTVEDGYIIWQNGESELEFEIPTYEKDGETLNFNVSRSALKMLSYVLPYGELEWEEHKLAGVQGSLLIDMSGLSPLMFDQIHCDGNVSKGGERWFLEGKNGGVLATFWLRPASR